MEMRGKGEEKQNWKKKNCPNKHYGDGGDIPFLKQIKIYSLFPLILCLYTNGKINKVTLHRCVLYLLYIKLSIWKIKKKKLTLHQITPCLFSLAGTLAPFCCCQCRR